MDQRNRKHMIPLYIVTGFLGSGKTTLLKRILNEHAERMKIGVIQNEFAPGNSDGVDLKQTGKPFEILEINNGSVFCVRLLGDFITSLQKFVEQQNPDCVIVEASGLADPISIGELLHAPQLERLHLAHLWSIVDASSFMTMQPRMTRITHQVRVADTVIINKIDLIDNTKAVEQRVKELNPYARVPLSSFCDIPAEPLLQPETAGSVVSDHAGEWRNIKPGGRPAVNSAVLRISRSVTPERLERFLTVYTPKTLRMKGYVVCTDGSVRAVQCASGLCNQTVINGYSGVTELIAMGKGIDPEKMRVELTGK
ncbi:MAG: CobW family GTP-binding protein [candidate division KSB1 bacterium]|nr:CobW family GTP-binding protein [candidate division KSB1 bacterium]